MELATLINQMEARGDVSAALNDPRAQFRINGRNYLGARVLPERNVQENAFREYGIEYRSVVANDGTRYSPVQLKGKARTGSFLVELGNSDIGSQLVGPDLEALRRVLNGGSLAGGDATAAIAQITNFLVRSVIRPLVEKNEAQRWEALADAIVYRRGDNGYAEDVTYSNPAGHRVTVASGTVAAPAGWYSPTYNPLNDIYKQADLLANKGYPVTAIYTSNRIASLLKNSAEVGKRTNGITYIDAGGNVKTASGRVTLDGINALLAQDGIPPIVTYDLMYDTVDGTRRFLRDTAFVMVSSNVLTQDEIEALTGNSPLPQPTTLGYEAIGIPEGQAASGRVAFLDAYTREKPARVEAKGWQTSAPVILRPEAVAVINIPYQTA